MFRVISTWRLVTTLVLINRVPAQRTSVNECEGGLCTFADRIEELENNVAILSASNTELQEKIEDNRDEADACERKIGELEQRVDNLYARLPAALGSRTPRPVVPLGGFLRAVSVGDIHFMQQCTSEFTFGGGLTQVGNTLYFTCGTDSILAADFKQDKPSPVEMISVGWPSKVFPSNSELVTCQGTETLYAIAIEENTPRVWRYNRRGDPEWRALRFLPIVLGDPSKPVRLSITSTCDLILTVMQMLYVIDSETGELKRTLSFPDDLGGATALEGSSPDSFVLFGFNKPGIEVSSTGSELRRYSFSDGDTPLTVTVDAVKAIGDYGYFVADAEHKLVTLMNKELSRNRPIDGIERGFGLSEAPRAIYYNEITQQFFIRITDFDIKVYNITVVFPQK